MGDGERGCGTTGRERTGGDGEISGSNLIGPSGAPKTVSRERGVDEAGEMDIG